MGDASPEKAGVGGSTPSLATIVFKQLPRNSSIAPTHTQPTLAVLPVFKHYCSLQHSRHHHSLLQKFQG